MLVRPFRSISFSLLFFPLCILCLLTVMFVRFIIKYSLKRIFPPRSPSIIAKLCFVFLLFPRAFNLLRMILARFYEVENTASDIDSKYQKCYERCYPSPIRFVYFLMKFIHVHDSLIKYLSDKVVIIHYNYIKLLFLYAISDKFHTGSRFKNRLAILEIIHEEYVQYMQSYESGTPTPACIGLWWRGASISVARLMHAYNIVRAQIRQRKGASGIPVCMQKGVFHTRRSSFSRYWLSIRSRASRLCRSARTSMYCALQEGPRDHYVFHRCFKSGKRRCVFCIKDRIATITREKRVLHSVCR